ncbi:histidine kinase dimerization/phosphoacceptor domain -containing protein [Leptospira sp. 96542]|nr:histidine kinase dimerization/phosphoacceptor domain -containing protein [Leptospira sp. 96542]
MNLENQNRDLKRIANFESFRSSILEQLVNQTPFSEILLKIVEGIESFNPEMICTILLIENNRLKLGACPNMPKFYNDSIEGVEIGEGKGSCGTAAYLKKRVVVEDIATHPYWKDYRDVALEAGLKSCWSEPIISPNDGCIATFAIYHTTPCFPKKEDVELIEGVANLLNIAIIKTKQTNEVESLLIEKEIILKEVHHRIKNNMSVMFTLLDYQSKTMVDPAAVTVLKDAAGRIKTMGLLYDKLYMELGFNDLALDKYLVPLVEEILSIYPIGNEISVRKNIHPTRFRSDKLQPIGIITNELLTNIMKYAFKEKTEGREVSIFAYPNETNFYLEIEDNGSGLSNSFDLENSEGFGLNLVKMLTKQLKGKLSIQNLNGTKFQICFPI